MAYFAYQAVSSDGAVVKGKLSASNTAEAERKLGSTYDMILYIRPASGKEKNSKDLMSFFSGSPKISRDELIEFTKQLSVMLKAGMPLLGSLDIIWEQTGSKSLKTVVGEIKSEVEGGASLGDSLGKQKRSFNPLYVSMIKAGESSGVLDDIVSKLSIYIEQAMELQKNVKSALRYPIIVMTALILAFVGAVTFVIPKFSNMFASQQVELPLPTKIIMGVSQLMTTYGMYTLTVILVLVIVINRYIHTTAGRKLWDSFKLKLPVVGALIKKEAIARFAHMLSTLNSSGIPIVASMDIVAATMTNVILKDLITHAKERLSQGEGLADAVSGNKIFPLSAVRMIKVGETSGALNEMLLKVSNQYTTEVNDMVKTMSSLIEPIMTLALGGLLLLIALAIFLPMWNMYSAF